MNRRKLISTFSSTSVLLVAGCLEIGRSADGVEKREPSEWPDEPTEAAVTAYTSEAREVAEHNRRLAERDSGSYEELNYSCTGAFEAETDVGYVVTTICDWSSTVDRGFFGDRESSHGVSGPDALLVSEDDVFAAELERDHDALGDEPPFSTRGITVVNFTDDSVTVEVTIDRADDEKEASESPVLEEAYDLEPTTGRATFGALEETGSFDVTATTNGGATAATAAWTIDGEPRDPDREAAAVAGDVGLGVYVRPDGALEIREIPEEREVA